MRIHQNHDWFRFYKMRRASHSFLHDAMEALLQKNLYEKISRFSRSVDVGYVKFIFTIVIKLCQSASFDYFSHISFGFLLDLYRISETIPKEI